MQKFAAMPQRFEKSVIAPPSALSATTAIECPCSSSMRATSPGSTPTETALTRPFSQLAMPASHSSLFAFPAAHTRIVLSGASAWARVTIVSPKFARRSASL